ncbi:AT-rich interactive domain-containing protein 1-like isoform X2 [Phalaenopsis equestris]|uniref:AT-rich interactive domain-containing protein 1-like isoform X2 n=1 Tax=Phalaenopsis equestris TaxID=78828 RepID=UPI0009E32278|nr:AT-rich interactive domain-containing protein 1-like isoform X2 [Phalaenopsis equestris]
MPELSHYGDGRILDSLMLPYVSVASAEAELRSLFHQLSSHGGLVSELLLGSEPNRPDHSELFSSWVQRLHAQVTADGEKREDREERLDAPGRWLNFCPDLRRRIKKLVSIVVGARSSGSEKPDNFFLKQRSDSMRNVLLKLRNVAADPCDKVGPNQEFKDQILRARKVLFLRAEEISISDMEEFPYRSRKRRAHLCPSETSGGTEGEMLNQPKRRSQRTLGLLKIGDSHLPRTRIPVGSSFQADVPAWTGPPSNKLGLDGEVDAVDTRWLGTPIWPAKGCNVKKFEGNIGKGRPDFCHCTHPGSVECIKIHVNSARRRLKSNLGPVFNYWGFNDMGEDVSNSWTSEEQTIFDNIVRLNPLSENKSFLGPASKFFTSKSKKDIVNYYYNVYVLRRMSIQTRVVSGTIDSDDDEGNDFRSYAFVPVPEVSYSISSQSV